MSINDEIPKSRITLTYRTQVEGEAKDMTLPFRVLVMGDLSGGSSKDRLDDLDKRQVRTLSKAKDLDSIMKDMAMTLDVVVDDKITKTGTVKSTLKIDSMKSFSPAVVAQQVPNVRALLVLKTLLLEAQANIDNEKEFRQRLRALAQNRGEREKLKGELTTIKPGYKFFELPEHTAVVPKPESDDQDNDGQLERETVMPSNPPSNPPPPNPPPSNPPATAAAAATTTNPPPATATTATNPPPPAATQPPSKPTTATPPLVTLDAFLTGANVTKPSSAKPMLKGSLQVEEGPTSNEDRFLSKLAAVVYNMSDGAKSFDRKSILDLISVIDTMVSDQLNAVLHDENFQAMEANWRSVQDLVENTNFNANISISLLDVKRDELASDMELNLSSIDGSELFKKAYVHEYDQFGGLPYGVMIGLFEFDKSDDDLQMLEGLGKVAVAAHAPFIGAVKPQFFGKTTMAEVNQIRNLGGLMATPAYRAWNKLREKEVASYLGLVMPKFMVRPPYDPVDYPAKGLGNFKEDFEGSAPQQGSIDDKKYVWGNAAMLFARNLVKSFEKSGWCQSIRGVKGGGLLQELATHTYNLRGEVELKSPVEISMPDYREYELAQAGFIPLIHKKGTTEAVFFSAQSIKKAHEFKDPKKSENSQLVTNLSYTFSISRIAHYLKCIMRDNIGSTANAAYIYSQIDRWISGYVTTLVNPDDLTLRYYPFKAYALDVAEKPGQVGWYHCNLSILPHIQFEGLDVDLRVDAALGSK